MTNTREEVTMLPCPFCGSRAAFNLMRVDDEDDCDVGFVECTNIDCVTQWAPQPYEEMARAWNTRRVPMEEVGGWKLVPVKPTSEMWNEAENVSMMVEHTYNSNALTREQQDELAEYPTYRIWHMVTVYKAMVAAAPSAQPLTELAPAISLEVDLSKAENTASLVHVLGEALHKVITVKHIPGPDLEYQQVKDALTSAEAALAQYNAFKGVK